MSETDEVQKLRRQLAEKDDTTLEEYLRYCHEHLFKSLRVRTASRLTTSSQSTTSVAGKYYPLKLRPWENFLNLQRIHYGVIREVLSDTRLLPSLSDVKLMVKRAKGKSVRNEADLKRFEDMVLEDPVERIYEAFRPRCQSHRMTQGLDCAEVIFINQTGGLQEPDDDENSECLARPTRSGKPRLGIPDRWCARWTVDEATDEEETSPNDRLEVEQIAFPIEYKAAHKIGVQDFETALPKEDLFGLVLSSISSHKVSTGDDRDVDRNEEKVAKALAQIFHYMVCCRSTFGFLTAGRSLIFLRVDEDAQVLYHHMVQPEKDAEGDAIDPFFTGVAQLSAFCLQSFLDPGKTKEWLDRAQVRLQQWPDLYSEMREPIAELPSSSPGVPSTTSYVPSSPTSKDDPSHSPPGRLTRSSCKDLEPLEGGGDPGDTDSDEDHYSDDEGIQPPTSMALANSRKRKKGTSDSGRSASTDGSSFDLDAQQYCTQACLLGLKRRDLLDENCPNVALHRSLEGDSRHLIDASQLVQLLSIQMGERHYRYRYCKPVEGKYGARGQLFKLSLRKHGYTFVGKGTFAAAVPSIEHESEVYSRLSSLQGRAIPVCLGSIDLEPPYPILMAFIVHILLLSWGGDPMAEGAFAEEQQESLKRLLLNYGVSHNDMRRRNVLWNKERGAAMAIDFDCATMQLPAKHNQILRLSGKRKRRANDTGAARRKAIPSSGL